MGRRAARASPEARRLEILEAAGQCFGERGFDATTIDEIASRAGVSKGAIYWHFEGKQDLLLALLDRFFDATITGYRALVAGTDSVRACLRAFFEVVLLDPSEGSIVELSLEYAAHAARNEDLRRHFEQLYKRTREVVLEPISRGIASGEIRAVDPERVVSVIFAILDGLMIQKALTPEMDLAQACAVAEDLLLVGLLAPTSGEAS